MKWISVVDDLPESFEMVLVCEKREGTGETSPVSIAHMDNWWASYHDGDIDVKKITHWMPFPSPP